MAEGIMGLAPGMGAPAAPQQAPQADPRGMQAFMDATGQMDPAEVQGQMDEAIGEVDPALAQQIQADLSAVQLSPEIITILLDVVDELLEVPQQYAQSRMEFIEAGLPAEFLPEEFDLEYLSTLRYVLTHLTPQEAAPPVQGFKKGGPVSLKPIAQFLASQGRGGDTILAHINKSEAAMLKRMGGAGTINPVTGLVEYNFLKKARDKVTKALKKVGSVLKKVVAPVLKVTKKLLSNPLVRTAAIIATAVFFPPAAMFSMASGTVAAAAVNYGISTAGIGLLAGEKPKDALKQGLIAGAGAGLMSYAGGAPLTGKTQDLNLIGSPKTTVRSTFDRINPFSDGPTPTVTADTEFAKLTGKGLPADAQTYRLATEAAKTANASTILGMTTPQALTTAATLVPPVLSYMGQQPPPTPEDLNIPGVGGPTGADLLDQDPGKYGVTIGDTSSTYADPFANAASTPALQIGSGSGEPAPVPGAPTPLPGAPTAPFATVNTPMPGSAAYEQMFSGYDPTKDPMSPLYNPFASPTQVATAPGNLTGGFDTTQGFAQGGIATLAPQGYSRGGSTRTGSQRTRGGSPGSASATRAEDAYYKKLFGGTNQYATTASKPKSQEVLRQEADASRRATERATQRSTAEKNARIAGVVQTAQTAAKEGRPFELGNSYKSEQQDYLAAINNARSSNPTSFMTPAQAEAFEAQRRANQLVDARKTFDQDQSRILEVKRLNEIALADKARADQEIKDFEAYKASILGAGGSTQPIVPGGGAASPVSIPDIATPPAPTPAPQPIQDISIGSASAIPVTPSAGFEQPVYGPDGQQFASPSAAITAGVFQYSSTPPAASGGIGGLAPTAPVTPNFTLDQNMFAPPPNVNVSPTNVPASFANGGIAAMAPYRFSRGSSPTQQYPRRTGPINGPGTGTSDSIPAMLSDGEFVFTAKAVRNMGGGSRLDGAKKMYKMMKMLERKS